MAKPTISLELTCKFCDYCVVREVPEEAIQRWKQGVHIQYALSMLPASEREMLMTRICGRCWDVMFKEED